MATALIAGGAGFVGSHLAERLLGSGWRVVGVDNFCTGSRDNIASFAAHPAFSLIEADVAKPFVVDGPIDRVWNLASPASPIHYQKEPVVTLWTNVVGTKHLLDLARAHGARFLQASTSEVYGDPLVHPQPESYRGNVNPVGPRACYDEGKRAAETLCADYVRQYGIPVRVARIFNTYGPRMSRDDGRVVSNFIVQALAGADITVYGEGTQTRSFQYVDDLIDGLLALMESDVEGAVNLGNPDEHTVQELAERVIAATDSKSRIVRMPLPEDDPARRNPVIARARDELGWAPKVPLAEGLAKTIDFFRAKV